MSSGRLDVWLLGSSVNSARMAAAFGLPYVYAHFLAPDGIAEALAEYRAELRSRDVAHRETANTGEAMAAVHVICAESHNEAHGLYAVQRLQELRRSRGAEAVKVTPKLIRDLAPHAAITNDKAGFPKVFVGTPDCVAQQLSSMATQLNIKEYLVNTITHDHKSRLRSYSLLAEACRILQL